MNKTTIRITSMTGHWHRQPYGILNTEAGYFIGFRRASQTGDTETINNTVLSALRRASRYITFETIQ